MRRSGDGTSSIVVAGLRHDVGTGLPDPKPGLLSAHLKLNLPPAVGVDVLHPEFERAKLGNDGLDPHRNDLTGRHIG
jgi:hypothetical protein